MSWATDQIVTKPDMTAPTREALLDAADELFGEVGFDAASTRRIGELSGVNKALIHYHFKDKSELWSSVLDRYYARLDGELRAALERGEGARAKLVGIAATYLDFLAENRSFARMVQREIADGRHVDRITAHMTPLFETGAALVEAAYPGARSGPLSAAQLLVSFYGMAASWVLYAPVVQGLTGADPLSRRALAARKEHLTEMVDLVIARLDDGGSRPVPRRTGKRRKA